MCIVLGPVGCEVACEIAAAFPKKHVTLVHAPSRLLPNWSTSISSLMTARLQELNVAVHTDERVKRMPGSPVRYRGERSGRVYQPDYVIVATGAKRNVDYLPPRWLDAKKRVVVEPSLRIPGLPNIFAAGDITDIAEEKSTFAAMCAGLCVARNI
ncbi:hypothetical protein THASP1DRAFT_18048, partial [Thamnocephalis sphaerospora]